MVYLSIPEMLLIITHYFLAVEDKNMLVGISRVHPAYFAGWITAWVVWFNPFGAADFVIPF